MFQNSAVNTDRILAVSELMQQQCKLRRFSGVKDESDLSCNHKQTLHGAAVKSETFVRCCDEIPIALTDLPRDKSIHGHCQHKNKQQRNPSPLSKELRENNPESTRSSRLGHPGGPFVVCNSHADEIHRKQERTMALRAAHLDDTKSGRLPVSQKLQMMRTKKGIASSDYNEYVTRKATVTTKKRKNKTINLETCLIRSLLEDSTAEFNKVTFCRALQQHAMTKIKCNTLETELHRLLLDKNFTSQQPTLDLPATCCVASLRRHTNVLQAQARIDRAEIETLRRALSDEWQLKTTSKQQELLSRYPVYNTKSTTATLLVQSPSGSETKQVLSVTVNSVKDECDSLSIASHSKTSPQIEPVPPVHTDNDANSTGKKCLGDDRHDHDGDIIQKQCEMKELHQLFVKLQKATLLRQREIKEMQKIYIDENQRPVLDQLDTAASELLDKLSPFCEPNVFANHAPDCRPDESPSISKAQRGFLDDDDNEPEEAYVDLVCKPRASGENSCSTLGEKSAFQAMMEEETNGQQLSMNSESLGVEDHFNDCSFSDSQRNNIIQESKASCSENRHAAVAAWKGPDSICELRDIAPTIQHDFEIKRLIDRKLSIQHAHLLQMQVASLGSGDVVVTESDSISESMDCEEDPSPPWIVLQYVLSLDYW
jgi:hypothetical protein